MTTATVSTLTSTYWFSVYSKWIKSHSTVAMHTAHRFTHWPLVTGLNTDAASVESYTAFNSAIFTWYPANRTVRSITPSRSVIKQCRYYILFILQSFYYHDDASVAVASFLILVFHQWSKAAMDSVQMPMLMDFFFFGFKPQRPFQSEVTTAAAVFNPASTSAAIHRRRENSPSLSGGKRLAVSNVSSRTLCPFHIGSSLSVPLLLPV